MKTKKIDKKTIVFKNGEPRWNVIVSETGYLLFQESFDEYAVDYYVLNSDLEEVDGGIFAWGVYNPLSEKYDLLLGSKGCTYEELLTEANTVSKNICFDDNSLIMTDLKEIEEIWEAI